MFSGLIVFVAFINFIVGVIMVLGNLFPFAREAVEIGLMLCGSGILFTAIGLWGVTRD